MNRCHAAICTAPQTAIIITHDITCDKTVMFTFCFFQQQGRDLIFIFFDHSISALSNNIKSFKITMIDRPYQKSCPERILTPFPGSLIHLTLFILPFSFYLRRWPLTSDFISLAYNYQNTPAPGSPASPCLPTRWSGHRGNRSDP